MSEPTQVEDRASQRRGPSTNAPTPTNGEAARPGGLRSKLRAATYSEGEQLLQPEAPVQLKPDPEGRGPKPKPKGEVDILKGKVGALEQENAGLKEEVTGLRTENAERKRETDDVNAKVEAANAALVKGWEQDVDLGVDDVHAHLRDANAAMTGLEDLVERTLVGDDQLRAANKGVAGAIEAHKEAAKPDFLDGLSMLLDVANVLKSGLTLIKTARKSIADGGGKAAILGASLDLATDVDGATNNTIDWVGKDDAAADGDTTVAMVAAVDAKVDAADGKADSLLKYAFGKEMHAVYSTLDAAARARKRVQGGADNLGDALSPKLRARLDGLQTELATAAPAFERRISMVGQLLTARDPATGGGGELAKGSTGRSAFDLVARNPRTCTLRAETELRVVVKDEDDFAATIARTGYWLSVADPNLRSDLSVPLFPHLIHPSSRPPGVGKDAWHVPLEIGQPMSTLIPDTAELPYEVVHLKGKIERSHATRAEWEDPKLRRNLFALPRYDSSMDR